MAAKPEAAAIAVWVPIFKTVSDGSQAALRTVATETAIRSEAVNDAHVLLTF